MTMPDEYDRPEYKWPPLVMLCRECNEWATHEPPEPVCVGCMAERRARERGDER